MFEKLTSFADEAIQDFNWKDIRNLKICVLSIGVILGTAIPSRKKKPVIFVCGVLYVVTLVMLFSKMFGFACPFCKNDEDYDFDEFDEDDYDDMDDGFVMKISAED